MSIETITIIGIAVQTIFFLLGGYAMVLRSDWSNRNLQTQVTDMNKEIKKLAEVVTIQAVQTTRIDNLTALITMLQRNVEELRRGNGWVQGTKGIDHEY